MCVSVRAYMKFYLLFIEHKHAFVVVLLRYIDIFEIDH